MSSSPRRWRAATPIARLETDEQSARRLAALLAETFPAAAVAVSLVDGRAGRCEVMAYFAASPDRDAVRALAAAAAGPAAARALRFQHLGTKDWSAETLAGLKPVEAGRFVVHGAHDRARVAANRIGIEIEAALAFGTGHHGTTRGCLLALDWLCKSLARRRPAGIRHPWRTGRILDLGTGSGILAIAAARALRQPVLATDIDTNAVRAAQANVRLNGVSAMVDVVKADGVSGGALRPRSPFELVFANILLRPLQRFARPLVKSVAPGARIVLSGLLASQANAAIAAYRGLALERRIELDGWTTLIFVRRTRPGTGVARHRPEP